MSSSYEGHDSRTSLSIVLIVFVLLGSPRSFRFLSTPMTPMMFSASDYRCTFSDPNCLFPELLLCFFFFKSSLSTKHLNAVPLLHTFNAGLTLHPNFQICLQASNNEKGSWNIFLMAARHFISFHECNYSETGSVCCVSQ